MALLKSVSNDMENSTPDFAIFQNSKTRESALWLKEVGEWKRCSESDYDPILIMAIMIRTSPNPSATLKAIADMISNLD